MCRSLLTRNVDKAIVASVLNCFVSLLVQFLYEKPLDRMRSCKIVTNTAGLLKSEFRRVDGMPMSKVLFVTEN